MVLSPEIHAKVKQLMENAEKGAHVQNVQNIIDLLQEENLVYTTKICPRFVHAHPENRDGVGVSPVYVHELLVDVLKSGWNWREVRPICVEVSHRDCSRITTFNQQLVAQSKGLLANVEAGTVKYASLACSHTSQMLRLLHYQCHHEHEELCVDKRLSLDKLLNRDKEFHKAATEGLNWQVIAAEVIELYPSLPALVQQSLNTGSQLQKGETELQMARRIHTMLASMPPGSALLYEQVRDRVSRTKPACLSSLPMIFKFIIGFGGKEWLLDTEMATKACTPRTLGPDFWEALSKDMKGYDFIHLRHACLQLGYMAPEKYMSAADVKRLFNNQMMNHLVNADKFCAKIRDLASKADINDVELINKFHRGCVSLIMNKKHPEVTGPCETVEELAHVFVKEVADTHHVVLTNDWDEFSPKPAATVPGHIPSGEKGNVLPGSNLTIALLVLRRGLKSKHVNKSLERCLFYFGFLASQRLRIYDDSGRVTNVKEILAGYGFTIGCKVIRKDKVIAEICSFDGEDVHMKGEARQLFKCNYKSFVLGEFATFAAKKVPEFVDFVDYPLLENNHKTKIECLKALIISSSYDQYVNNSKSLDQLRICRKPNGVQTIGKIGKGKLQIFAYSNSVHVRKPGESPSANILHGCYLDDAEFSQAPMHFTDENGLMCPFWYVGVTHDPEYANMEVVGEGSAEKVSGNILHANVVKIMMKNTTTLEPGTNLRVYKDKKAKALDLEPLVAAKRLKSSKAAVSK